MDTLTPTTPISHPHPHGNVSDSIGHLNEIFPQGPEEALAYFDQAGIPTFSWEQNGQQSSTSPTSESPNTTSAWTVSILSMEHHTTFTGNATYHPQLREMEQPLREYSGHHIYMFGKPYLGSRKKMPLRKQPWVSKTMWTRFKQVKQTWTGAPPISSPNFVSGHFGMAQGICNNFSEVLDRTFSWDLTLLHRMSVMIPIHV